LFALFSKYCARIVAEPLQDFGRLSSGSKPYCAVAPVSLAEAVEIARVAFRERVPLRVRGAGHALNGSSLPTPGELVFETRRLASVRYERPGTVTSGAGVNLWVLNDLVRQRGFSLPVINDGYPGPSVGGYLAAGGFGAGSCVHGGFWENVSEVMLLTSVGVVRVTRDDAIFPWLFGAMGQLGVVLEVTLDVVSGEDNQDVAYPAGVCETDDAMYTAAAHVSGPPAEDRHRRLYWFTLFVNRGQLACAQDELSSLQARHATVFEYCEPYCYLIRHRGRVVAPLVYPVAEDFYATGRWGFHTDPSPTGMQRLMAFDTDFMQLVARRRYRRYVQSELSSGPETYRQYFDQEVLARLEQHKRWADPGSLFNRGWMFPT
jgi:FAD/FMN-containing dehydrogenase